MLYTEASVSTSYNNFTKLFHLDSDAENIYLKYGETPSERVWNRTLLLLKNFQHPRVKVAENRLSGLMPAKKPLPFFQLGYGLHRIPYTEFDHTAVIPTANVSDNLPFNNTISNVENADSNTPHNVSHSTTNTSLVVDESIQNATIDMVNATTNQSNLPLIVEEESENNKEETFELENVTETITNGSHTARRVLFEVDVSQIPTPSFWNEISFDWRDHVYFPPVKHQHKNECYAETAAIALDAVYQLKYPFPDANSAKFFSPDNLMRCAGHKIGETGLPSQILSLSTPFAPEEGCHGTTKFIKLSDKPIVFCDLWGDNNIEVKIKSMLKISPVSVGIESLNPVFRNYKSGILSPEHIHSFYGIVDHAVTVIGFGVDEEHDNLPYWIIRNSWGSQWGEEGYARIQRFSADEEQGKGVFNAYAAVVNAQ